MTEVAFHYNAPDKLAYTCRLLRKALHAGARLTVCGEPDLLARLDEQLWSFSALDFVPHGRVDSMPAPVLARTPIVLTPAPAASPHRDVLVNLGTGVPEGFEGHERLIEVVSQEDQDRQCGRRRWKHYADRGYAVVRHEVGEAR